MTTPSSQLPDNADALVAMLLDPPFAHDPYPVASRLREIAPVHRTDRGFWLVSDAASVEQVYRSSTMRIGFGAARLEQAPQFADSPSRQLFARMLPFMDPPDHTRVRQVLAPYFTPRVMAGLRHYAEDLVERLLDRLEADGGGDLVYDFANDIPVAVVCHLLGGVGEEDQVQCRQWAEGLVEAVHPECTQDMQRAADEAAAAFGAYAERLIAGKGGAAKDGGGDDLVSRLVRAHRDGALDMAELVGTVTTLIGAAFHNTRNHIASGIYELLRHPDQLALLRNDLALAAPAAEELLRYDPPVQLSIPRLTTTEITMGGVRIGPGELVAGLISGANRDPRRYGDPDRLDIERKDGGSISFASGIHSCIGAAMARMEAQVAIGRFSQRFPRARLIDEIPDIEPRALPLTRGYREIRIAL
jgi:cytochrome P450